MSSSMYPGGTGPPAGETGSPDNALLWEQILIRIVLQYVTRMAYGILSSLITLVMVLCHNIALMKVTVYTATELFAKKSFPTD